ncbi:DeoR/GlpR family DNA-binding transcription regulator [Rhizobium jaguaris]|uniref:DeoR/GlpR transcriptional regulator n=1 Tax=Rhizobium jaguaris TaxID=1312183 RepID=A0A387FWR4_9HYPH|nr:DeoR/GlpR family DNA-binding transcription regulator [Rhizobium jaguaris]AYG61665.1 DeoR/GlpR transcriptional regulator [Rhizobium jaguaris]
MSGFNQRKDALLRLLQIGAPTVQALSAALNVSVATVRRDLAALAEEGVIARTYGGATLLQRAEPTFDFRMRVAAAAKRRIAEAAFDALDGASTIFLDAGTTVGALAEKLALMQDSLNGLVVVTQSHRVAAILADIASIELFLLGGRYRANSEGVFGPLAERTIEAFRFEKIFLGADSVSAEFGLGETTLEQVRLKEIAMQRTQATIVLADATKFQDQALPFWARLPEGAKLFTDEASEQMRQRYRDAGFAICTAQ